MTELKVKWAKNLKTIFKQPIKIRKGAQYCYSSKKGKLKPQ